jgi:hypothetical protein
METGYRLKAGEKAIHHQRQARSATSGKSATVYLRAASHAAADSVYTSQTTAETFLSII